MMGSKAAWGHCSGSQLCRAEDMLRICADLLAWLSVQAGFVKGTRDFRFCVEFPDGMGLEAMFSSSVGFRQGPE